MKCKTRCKLQVSESIFQIKYTHTLGEMGCCFACKQEELKHMFVSFSPSSCNRSH
jgi:hypothetical protein